MDESLLGDFITETQGLLEEIEISVLQLKENSNDIDLINEIFRFIHTIKGSSEYLGMTKISEVAHKLENLLDLIRQKKHQVDDGIIQLLMDVRDRIELLLKELENKPDEETIVEDLVSKIEGYLVPVHESSLIEKDDSEDDQSEKSMSDSESGLLTSAFSDEDEELFTIFIEQFKDGFLKLKGEIDRLSQAEHDVGNIISNCIDYIYSLRFSANYMGYDPLCKLYDQWIDQISSFETVLNGGDPDRFSRFVKEVMQPTANKLSGLFPEKWIDFSFNIDIPEVINNASADGKDLFGANGNDFGTGLFDSLEEEIEDTNNGEDYFDDEELSLSSDNGLDQEELTLSDDFLTDEPEPEPELELGLEQDIDVADDLHFSDRSLLEDFIDEAEEHLNVIESSLLSMLNDQVTNELVDNTFRSAHTIKGSAEYLGLKKAAELLHKMENILDLMRHGKRTPGKESIEILIEAKDVTHELVKTCMDPESSETIETGALLDKLAGLVDAKETKTVETPNEDVVIDDSDTEPDPSSSVETRIDLEKKIFDDFQEDYDEELYAIFLEQFDSSLNILVEEIKAASPSQIHKILESCLVYISKLRSSANYMGYDKLKSLYDLWNSEIKTFISSDAINDESVASEFLARSMLPWVEKIKSIIYPSENKTLFNVGLFLTEEGGDSSGEEIDDIKLDDDDLDIYVEEPDMEVEQFDAVVHEEPEQKDQIIDLSQFPEIVLESDERDLFQKLEKALNASIPQYGNKASNRNDANIDPGLLSSEEEQKDITPHDQREEEEEVPKEMSDVFQDMQDEILRLQNERGVDFLSELYLPSTEETGIFRTFEERFVPPGQELDYDISPEVNDAIISPRQKAIKHNVRVDASKIDVLMNQIGELVVNRSVFTQLANELKSLQLHFKQHLKLDKRAIKPIKDFQFKLSEATASLGRVANDLQEGVMKVRMLPISQLFNRYPRLVHDLAKTSNKKVVLDIKGAETELDRMVIEEISDPLIHIIRNAVDHGIETQSIRKEAGKPEAGTISLDAYHESNHVIIEIIDDGMGLDLNKIKAKAIESNIISDAEAEKMTSAELSDLITIPGFSTADKITHTSGRGVGMDVVKKNIESLNGTLEIYSDPGRGTRLRIKIPLTIAIFPALMVRVGDELYTIPLSLVEETIRIHEEDIFVIDDVESIYLRNEKISLLPLPKVFKKRDQLKVKDQSLYAVIINNGKVKIGLIVDQLVGKEEVVIKPLEDYLQENSGFSGATILGDGQISLILDIHELVKLTLDRKSKIVEETVI